MPEFELRFRVGQGRFCVMACAYIDSSVRYCQIMRAIGGKFAVCGKIDILFRRLHSRTVEARN